MPQTGAGQPTDRKLNPSSSGPRGSAIDEVLQALLGDFTTVQYHYVQFFSEHLVDCSATFGGDLDSVALLAILGQRHLAARTAAANDDVEGIRDRSWMSTSRIADVSGIPRETVRRKLLKLESRGWVERLGTRGWVISGAPGSMPIGRDLSELTHRSMNRVARFLVAMRPFLPASPPDKRDDATGQEAPVE